MTGPFTTAAAAVPAGGWADRDRDFDDFKASVLASCQEHDLCVNEVWKDAGLRYPQMSARPPPACAKVIEQLLDEDKIRLVRGRRLGPADERSAVEDVGQKLLEWSTWTAQGDSVVWLEALDRD